MLNEVLLKRLTDAAGASGHEEQVRAIVREQMAPLVDKMRTDVLGNVIGTRRGRADVRVMVAAHMDEVGFMVKWIDDGGFVRVHPIGYGSRGPGWRAGDRFVGKRSGIAWRGAGNAQSAGAAQSDRAASATLFR